MNNDLSWSFYNIWNESLENRAERLLKPRTHAWAGELNGSFIDRYLKMTAVEPTNPPNARSLRKFEAGNLMEWVVKMVLKRAGILVNSQEWVEYQYPGLIRVTGKLDHEAGGVIDWKKAESEIKLLELPEFFDKATRNIIKTLSEKYPEGMRKVVLEVKSLSSFQFEAREAAKTPALNHALQAYHYLKAKNYPEAHIVYICRDDLRMLEFGIFNPSTYEDLYKADIEKMTNFIYKKITPEKEPLITFDAELGRFNKNWKVEYSNYLTMLYGFERPDIYSDEYSRIASTFNRAYNRNILVEVGGKTPTGKFIALTPGNIEGIKQLKEWFPNYDELLKIGVELYKKGVVKTGDEQTE